MANKILRLRFGASASAITADTIASRVFVGDEALEAVGSSAIGSVATDRSGNIYFTDFEEHAVYKVSSDGSVSLLAGLPGTSGINGTQTNVAAGDARFNAPKGITVDKSGNIYVADSGNNQIRMIAGNRVSFVAGSATGASGNDDGVGDDATFDTPWDVSVDNSGVLWVADLGNHSVRRIKDGNVYTYAGGVSGDKENVLNNAGDIFNGPTSVAANKRGDVLVADAGNNKVKKIDQAGKVYLHSGSGDAGTSLGTGLTRQFTCEYEGLVGIHTDANTSYVIDSDGAESARLLRLDANGVPSLIFEFDADTGAEGLVGVAIDRNQDIILAIAYDEEESSSSSEEESSSSSGV